MISKLEIRDIERREFAFETDSEKRHFIRKKSFKSISDADKFITKNKPANSFVSVAYWIFPQFACAPDDRGCWKGADYFVDIDYENHLKEAKTEAQIARWVMIEKLGLEEGDIEIYFSGNKGYHVIAFNPASEHNGKTLGIDERKELANYFLKFGVNHLDVPAFCDTHRIRRIPGTINSKSGKICQKV